MKLEREGEQLMINTTELRIELNTPVIYQGRNGLEASRVLQINDDFLTGTIRPEVELIRAGATAFVYAGVRGTYAILGERSCRRATPCHRTENRVQPLSENQSYWPPVRQENPA